LVAFTKSKTEFSIKLKTIDFKLAGHIFMVRMRRFCYRCGASDAEKGPSIQGLCQSCFVSENPLVVTPAEIELDICSRCKAYFIGKIWHEPNNKESALEEAARAAVISELRFAQLTPGGTKFLRYNEVKGLELSMEAKSISGEVIVDVHARGKVHELQVSPQVEHVTITVKPRWITCDVCGLLSAGHHEAILQVRAREMSFEKRQEIKLLLEQAAEEAHKKNRSAFISKLDEKREGLDIYVNPAGLARRMASLLRAKFGAETVETAKLIGVDRDRGGVRKFKISVLARLPDQGSSGVFK
jgi:nonsense-mediated mRNA decay protein 3